MDKELSVFRVPGELEYLATERPSPSVPRTMVEFDPWSPRASQSTKLTGAASQRLSELARAELRRDQPSVAHPVWLQNRAIPRLIVSLRYNELDAFGASRAMARLDLAARRAGAMHRQLTTGQRIKAWPAPLRTYQGGLHLLDARVGSFDVLLTVWGTLVTIAASAPVSVASLIALAWDVGRGTVHVTKRWQGAALATAQRDRPSLDRQESARQWGIPHTKELAPVLAKAIENDQGFEFSLTDGNQSLKITVLPKD